MKYSYKYIEKKNITNICTLKISLTEIECIQTLEQCHPPWLGQESYPGECFLEELYVQTNGIICAT